MKTYQLPGYSLPVPAIAIRELASQHKRVN